MLRCNVVHVGSRIIKVVSTKSIVIISSKDRDTLASIISFLGNDSNVHENMMLPKLDTFVLLTNEGPSLEKDEQI